MKLPNHIAIIMDGNGRWGVKKHNNRLIGHHYGIRNIKHIIAFLIKKKISHLTLYALSNDNFKKRNKKELNNIFSLFHKYLKENISFFKKNKIFLNFFGKIKELDQKTLNLIKHTSETTLLKNNNLVLNIALNYSSKEEIINCFKILKKKKLNFNKNNIDKYLFTSFSGDPDIVIRTGGYKRLSDFLLWQSSYSELFFSKKLWPDFKANDLYNIIKKFNLVRRNYGS